MANTIMGLVREAIGGKNVDIARLLNVTDAAIAQWSKGGIPPARAIQLEEITGGKVTVRQLRPDLFKSAKRRKVAA